MSSTLCSQPRLLIPTHYRIFQLLTAVLQVRPFTPGHPTPHLTGMAQLVANMVFHRQQQDALRRSPTRSRTWSPAASITHTTASGKTRSWTQTSPTSPLRQMILPEDLDGNSESEGDVKSKDSILDSPLQLSPLCLGLCESPKSFYAQLGPTTSIPLYLRSALAAPWTRLKVGIDLSALVLVG
jgi:hypothetical protein